MGFHAVESIRFLFEGSQDRYASGLDWAFKNTSSWSTISKCNNKQSIVKKDIRISGMLTSKSPFSYLVTAATVPRWLLTHAHWNCEGVTESCRGQSILGLSDQVLGYSDRWTLYPEVTESSDTGMSRFSNEQSSRLVHAVFCSKFKNLGNPRTRLSTRKCMLENWLPPDLTMG